MHNRAHTRDDVAEPTPPVLSPTITSIPAQAPVRSRGAGSRSEASRCSPRDSSSRSAPDARRSRVTASAVTSRSTRSSPARARTRATPRVATAQSAVAARTAAPTSSRSRRGTTPRVMPAGPTSSVSTRPWPRPGTRTRSRSTSTSGRVRRRGVTAAPASNSLNEGLATSGDLLNGSLTACHGGLRRAGLRSVRTFCCRMSPKLHLPCGDGFV